MFAFLHYRIPLHHLPVPVDGPAPLFLLAVGFLQEGGKLGILPDLLPEASSETLRKGLRGQVLVEIGGQVGPDDPAAVVAGGPARGDDVLQQVGAFVREAKGQSRILETLFVSMVCKENGCMQVLFFHG